MKIATIIAGVLVGLVFMASGVVVLFGIAPMPKIPTDTPMGHFMAGFQPTGYMHFVKVLEVVGGLLIAFPRTRRAGLLVLGPILINILAFHCFVMKGEGLFSPVLIALGLLTAFLTWAERAAFLSFLSGRAITTHSPESRPEGDVGQ